MKVKFNSELSDFLALIGGGPQGTLLGQLEYLVQSNDNMDLSLLQLVCFSGLLMDYNFKEHVASDIGIEEQFLPPESFPTQETLDGVSSWTDENIMKINEKK